MKVLIFLHGEHVASWYAEDGESGSPSADSPQTGLAEWFRNGWKIHGGLPTNLNGGTLIVLRDGKPVDKWKVQP